MALDLFHPDDREVLKRGLTARQVEVVDAVARCGGYKTAARALGISRSTVREHEHAAMRRLEEEAPDLVHADGGQSPEHPLNRRGRGGAPGGGSTIVGGGSVDEGARG